MDYQKPHANYEEQLALLASRGLRYSDRFAAIRALKAIGYYRFSAYTYVLRKPKPEGSTTRSRREDEFIEGARFEDVLGMYAFDNHLRNVLFDGLQRVEVGLRVKIGYQLGKSDPNAHLDPIHLDQARCESTSKADPGISEYEFWLEKFQRQCSDAKNEEFVKHFLVHYDGKMPIWVATEVMSFGTLVTLYDLLSKRDADRIAKDLGVKDRDVLHKYLRSLLVLRNHCAHNARIWNRATVYPPQKPPAALTGDAISHLRSADGNRVYFLAALCAYIVKAIDPDSRWPALFKETVRKHFHPVNGMTPENSMGFTPNWDREALWDPPQS